MPPGAAGSVNQEGALNLAAFILTANGASAAQPMTAASVFPIRSVATGRAAAAAGPAATGPRGVTITGEVKNYSNVTDAMLKTPAPGDWLMIRRNYQAWSNSPLTDINTSNVKELQLAWSWSMNEGGANEPTPIVHDGVMFLSTNGDQARPKVMSPKPPRNRSARLSGMPVIG